MSLIDTLCEIAELKVNPQEVHPADMITIVLDNLRKVSYEGHFTVRLQVPIYLSLEGLNGYLIDKGWPTSY